MWGEEGRLASPERGPREQDDARDAVGEPSDDVGGDARVHNEWRKDVGREGSARVENPQVDVMGSRQICPLKPKRSGAGRDRANGRAIRRSTAPFGQVLARR